MLRDWERDAERLVDLAKVKHHGQILAGPNHVSYDITNRCNLKCLHCYNRSGTDEIPREELTDEQARDVFEQIAEIRPRSVCICGGEPLLRSELVFEGARRLTAAGTSVAMVTNGLLVTPGMAREMRRSGLVTVQVSVDGARAESHDRLRGLPGAFDRAVSALKHLRDAGVPSTGVAFCPTQFNIGEVFEAAMLAEDLGASEFRVQPMMLLGRAVLNRADIMPGQDQYLRMVRKLAGYESRAGMKVEWGDPVDHLIRFSGMLPESVPYVDVRSDGTVSSSLYLPLAIGKIQRHRLAEYWEAGLARTWSSHLVQILARMIRSTHDFYRPDAPVPLVFYERHMYVDLIDDNLLDMSLAEAEQVIVRHCAGLSDTA